MIELQIEREVDTIAEAIGGSRRQVAELIGVDRRTVWRWIQGHRRPCRRNRERLLAQYDVARLLVLAPIPRG